MAAHYLVAALMAAAMPSWTMDDEAAAANPVGGWQLGQNAGVCMGMRSFVRDRRKYTLTLRPEFTSRRLAFGYIDERQSFMPGDGTVEVTAAGSFRFRDVGHFGPSLYQIGSGASVEMPQGALTAIASAAQITIAARDRKVTFGAPDLSPIIAALLQCKAAKLRQWAIDPTVLDRIHVPAVADRNAARFFNSDAYPSDARRAGQQGRTVALMKIGTQGRITECRLLESSGSASLDRQSCNIAMAHIVYRPARDKNDQAIEGFDVWSINCVI